jgi:hypothetical protein
MELALVIDKFLSDKRHLITSEDSFNIVEGILFRWDFVNIQQPTQQELNALIPALEISIASDSARSQKIEAGKIARETCQMVLDLIAGYNLDRELTMEQISQLQNMLSQPEAALRAGRPSLAKLLISTIVPDEDLVTTEMKSEALLLLTGY